MTATEGELLLAACGERVYGLCLRLCRNQNDAQDLFQTAFVQAYAAELPPQAPPESRNAYNWLYTIALNAYRKQIKKSGRSQTMTSEWWEMRPDHVLDPQAAAEQAESQKALREAVQGLPDKYRIPIVLYYWAQWDTAQIAKALHVPGATVRTRLKRARETLAKVLEESPKGVWA